MMQKIRNPVIERLDLQVETGDLPSPCISVCRMEPQTGWCEGCLRTIDEIMQWSGAGEQRKREIWVEVKRRYQTIAENTA
jgi:predicted Fe-S protein YdhL (DUF1289 family)